MDGPLKKEVLLNELNDLIHNCFLNGLGQKEEKGDQAIVFHLSGLEGGILEQWCRLGQFECGWKDAGGEGRVDNVSDHRGDGGSYCL